MGCREMDEAPEWCWAGTVVLPPSAQLLRTWRPLPKAPFPLCLSVSFSALCPSTCYISLAHLSSSITGGPNPSASVSGLFLSPIPLIFLFPLCSTSADGNHSCQGYHMLMAQQVHLGLAGSWGLLSEWLLLPALVTCHTHLTTETYGHPSTHIQRWGVWGPDFTGAGR